MKSLPRKPAIIWAFFGDSTMTSARPPPLPAGLTPPPLVARAERFAPASSLPSRVPRPEVHAAVYRPVPDCHRE